MIIKRVGPMSLARIAGTLYALLGLLIGGVFSLIAVVGGALGGSESGLAGVIFGAAAVVVLPLLYACVGVVGALVGAVLFNLAAGWVGGVQIETE